MRDLLETITQSILGQRHLPESTYRFQSHKGFTFRDATRLVPREEEQPLGAVWSDTTLRLVGFEAGLAFRNIFTSPRTSVSPCGRRHSDKGECERSISVSRIVDYYFPDCG